MSRWNHERWQQTGTDTAGDPVYGRVASRDHIESGGDLHDLSKAELQELAEKAGVSKSGTKDEIIERLEA